MNTIFACINENIDSVARWFLASRWRRAAGVLSVFGGSLAIVFLPALYGEVFSYSRFIFVFHYSAFTFFANQIRHGVLPLWGEIQNGFPMFLSSEWGFFHPANLLFRFFPVIPLYNWLIFANFIAGGVFAYLFGLELRLSRISALALGAIYIFSETNIFWGSINSFAYFIPFLPLLFLLLLNYHRRRYCVFAIVAGSANIAVGLMTALTQLVFYAIGIALIFALFLDIRDFHKRSSLFRAFRATLYVAGIVCIGVIAVSYWFFPTVQYLQSSIRAGGVAAGLEKLSFVHWSDLPGLLSPLMKVPEEISKSFGVNGFSTLYFGVLPLLLVVFAFFIPKKNGIINFFLFLGIFSSLIQFRFTHFFTLLQRLPLFNLFRGVDKWLFFTHFSFAVVGAYTLDHIHAINQTAFRRIWKSFFALAVCIFLALGVFTVATGFLFQTILQNAFAYFDTRIFDPKHGLSLAYGHERIADMLYQLRGTFSLTMPSVGIAFAFLVLSLFLLFAYRRGLLRNSRFRQFSLALILLNSILLYVPYYRFLPGKTIESLPNVAVFLQEKRTKDPPFRISRILLDYYHDMLDRRPRDAGRVFDVETLRPNFSLLYGIDSAGGQSSVASRRQAMIENIIDSGALAAAGAKEQHTDKKQSDEIFPFLHVPEVAQRIQTFQLRATRRLLGMQNIKYLLAPVPLISGWKNVFETTVTEYKIPVFVLENSEVLPRVYFAGTPVFASSEDDALRRLLAIEDFKKETVIECNDTYCANLRQSPAAKDDNLAIEEIRERYLRVYTNAVSSHWLIYSESNLPTWEARIDGVPTSVYTANYLFQAIYVPAGEHEAEFIYPGIMKQFQYALVNLLGLQGKHYGIQE